jgi:cytochrome c553
MASAWRCALLFIAASAPASLAASPHYDYLDGTPAQPWEVCGECHGMDGVSWSDRFPNIAAQDKDYLLAEMRNFRDGIRSNDDHQMAAVLSGMSPAEMEAAAAWYAAQPAAPPAPADLTPPQRAWARQMVQQGSGTLHGCDSCHDKSEYRGIAMPHVDGERPGYLARQLRDFLDGGRADDPHGLMRRVARLLPPEQIDVLARYIGSLPRSAPESRTLAQRGVQK